MRKTILGLVCVSGIAAAPKPRSIKTPPPVPVEARQKAAPEANKEQLWKAERLQKQLEKEIVAKYKGDAKSEIRQGPFDTLLVRAWFPAAYPGTGVMAVMVDKTAVSYGIRGERDFADFVRAQGWLKTEPDVEDFMRVLDFAQFEAVVMNLSHLEAPTLKIEGDRLVLRFVRGFMPNGAYPTEVIVEKSGGVKIVQKSMFRK
jgi:hypothetical protein